MNRKRRIIILGILGALLVIYVCLFAAARHRRTAAFARLEARIAQIHTAQPEGETPACGPEAAARWEALWQRIDTELLSDEWDSIVEHAQETPSGQWTEQDWQNITAYVEANQEIFGEIRSVACVNARFLEEPISPDTWEEAFGRILDKHTTIRESIRQLHIAMTVQLHHGRLEEAAENHAAGFHLARRAAEDPSSIAQLVQVAGLQMALGFPSPVEQSWSREQAMRLVEAASKARESNRLAEAWAGEAAFGLAQMSNFTGTAPECPFWDNELVWLKEWAFYIAYANPFSTPWQDYDQGTYAIFMERLIALGEQPYYKAAPGMAAWYNDCLDLSAFNYLSSIVLPTMTEMSFQQTAKVNTQLDLFRLRLLVDLYKQEHGAYPKTLDPLANDLGGSIPVAPLTGNPYAYTPHEDYYILSQP